MAKKQAIIKETAVSATAAAAARVAKPNTPRVTAAKHSKVIATETMIETSSIEVVALPVSSVNPEEAIAKIAYGYWESRGYQGGSPHEDWVRAEHEYRQRLAATRL
jgi:Protein of unknown function (DUF2934)